MNYDSEHYFDQEITFTYDGIDYQWIGDYTIDYFGEDESELHLPTGRWKSRSPTHQACLPMKMVLR